MNSVIRAGLTAALTLPLSLPAAASTLVSLPAGAHSLQASFGGPQATPKSVLNNLLRHRTKKTAHFAFPYGVAVDSAGNLFVTNVDSNSVSIVSAAYKFSTTTITQGVSEPIGVALDSNDNLYVANNTGNINKFNSSFALLETITANAINPASIAVDQAQDIWIVSQTGELAVDDPYGNSIWSAIFGGSPQLFSVAIGAPNVYTFYTDAGAFGDISVGLRGNTLQYIVGPLSSEQPLGAACSQTQSLCWTGDTTNETLNEATLPGGGFSQSVGYQPAGLAVDPVRNRLYVADPINNAVHVYNASSLAFEKTLT